jgi:outer membrane protein assembly factor BamB
VIVGDKLIFSGDGAQDPFVAALDRATGEVVWKTYRSVDARSNFSFSTPLHIAHEGRSQLISPGSEGVFAYDPETGRELWRVRHGGYSVIPRPVYGHGLIFIGTGYNSPSLLAIRVDGQGDVTDTHIAWQHDRGAPHTPSALLVGDQLYIVSDNGVATCLDARSGEVHWQQRLGGNFSASPLYASGHVYFQNEEGRGFVVRAGTEYDLVAQNDLGERTLASYAVVEDSLLIRTAEHVYRIEP